MTIAYTDGDSDTATFDVTNGEVTEEEFYKAFPTDTAQGSIASYPDGANVPVKDLKVAVTPVQDLHGYSNPWVSSDSDQVPYVSRAMSSSTVADVGNHEMDTLVGGSIAWNQLIKNGNFNELATSASNGWVKADATVSVSDNVATVTATATGGRIWCSNASPVGNHKYMVIAEVKSPSATVKIQVVKNNGGANIKNVFSSGNNAWEKLATVIEYTPLTNNNFYFYVRDTATSDWQTYYVRNTGMFDLTQMFGSTIADYIYSLEQNTTGAGVAWFRALFPNDYYAYNTGELIHVNASAHKTYDANYNVIGNYALDSDLVLRGIPKLDANNRLYYDGDTYASNGTVTRKYGIVDLGTLTWTYQTEQNRFTSSTLSPTMKRSPSGRNADWLMCDKYVANISGADKTIFVYTGGEIYIYDSAYTDADAFTNSLSGVYLVYELATSTTESADPYTGTQTIVANGSEEYVVTAQSGVSMPVGHKSYYANICPITGWTGANVVRTGVNLWDEEWEEGIWNSSGAKNAGTAIRSKNYIPVKEGCSYYVYYASRYASGMIFRTYDINKTYVGNIIIYSKQVITIPSGIAFITMCSFTADNITTYNHDISINYPSTDHSYHAYSGNTYPFTFGQTVYGGTLDVTSGVLTIDRVSIDLGDYSWSKNTDLAWYTSAITDFKQVTASGYTHYGSAISDTYKFTDINLTPIGSFTLYYHSGYSGYRLFVYDDFTGLTANQVKAKLDGVNVVYLLASPITVQLSPTEVKSLLGSNNIFADCGDSEVVYLADPTLYIQKLTGSTEEDMVANANIANGKYFMVGNRLFISTSAIAQGATIVVGTNCVESNLAEALNALNA